MSARKHSILGRDTQRIFGHGSSRLIKTRLKTEVLCASFRNAGEILELAGCDLLTISPPLLGELKNSTAPVTRKLSPELAARTGIQKLDPDEKNFRWLFNEDAMATEKNAEVIRSFNADAMKLEKYVAKQV